MAVFSPLIHNASPRPEISLLTPTRPPDFLGGDGSAWRTLATSEEDALVVGDDLAVWLALTTVWPALQKPRFWCDSERQRPSLTRYTQGILVFQNVDALGTSDQEQLLSWCRGTKARSRIIATASPRIMTLVDNGTFSRQLYDCLGSTQVLLQ